MFRSNLTKSALLVSVLALLAAITAPGADAATQGIRARVEEPFEVQGRMFPPSDISIQELSDYNPTLSLNKVCVAGECLGLLLAETSKSEAADDEHALLFEREADGHLVLVGYSYRGSAEVQQFRITERLPMLSAADLKRDEAPGVL
jgi:hypothetical protein